MKLVAGASLLLAGLLAPTTNAEPFLTHNQNTLLALYGLPSPLPSRLPGAGEGRIAGVVNWSSTRERRVDQ